MATSAEHRGLLSHLSTAAGCGALVFAVQGLVEGILLTIEFDGSLLGPRHQLRSASIFILRRWLTGSGTMPLLPDRYLGPDALDKLPLLAGLVLLYGLLGLLGGALLGAGVWMVLRVRRAHGPSSLHFAYFLLIADLAVCANLLLWLKKYGKLEVSSSPGLAVGASVLLNGLLLGYAGSRLLARDSARSPAPLRTRRRHAIALGAAMGIPLLLAVFPGGFSSEPSGPPPSATARSAQPAPASGAKRPNVLLISIDTLRADHLGCYGYSRDTSPHIDRLARESVRFANAFSVSSWTVPAHLSMLTSLYPEVHGVVTDEHRLDENRVMLSEILKEAGYRTTAFVSGPTMNPVFGYDQGWDLYDHSAVGATSKVWQLAVTSPKVTSSAREWLQTNHESKFFLFLHYFDPHNHYVPPPPFDAMFDPDYQGTLDGADYSDDRRVNAEMDPRDLAHLIALYDGEIAFVDRHVGEIVTLLKELGLYDETLIVITSDHGEEFYDHGRLGHYQALYEESIHVPLLLKLPAGAALERNGVVERPVSLVDLAPTVLHAVGVAPHPEMQGKNLLSLDEDGAGGESLVYASLEDRLIAVRSERMKLIHRLDAPDKELYDLARDPMEKNDLFAIEAKPEGSRSHLLSLLDWLNAQRERSERLVRSGSGRRVPDETLEKQLEALGYVQ